ncbi:solute carrier family 25 member 48 isoform X3 [Saccopteryx leptura]|uniref:solute carrier family 25 member 48 isoform X3 n=1 Tax=Saccopteryx leptura TaxID=249018 RepID=UPI00339BD389
MGGTPRSGYVFRKSLGSERQKERRAGHRVGRIYTPSSGLGTLGPRFPPEPRAPPAAGRSEHRAPGVLRFPFFCSRKLREPRRGSPELPICLQVKIHGAWSGAASVIVGYPLDTVKTRLQAGVGYGNTLSCIRMVYRKESVFGFFKGMSFPLASVAVYNSVVFGVFSNTQRFLSWHQGREPEAGPPLSDLLLASMVAGVVSIGLGTPVDLIKIRLQMQTQPFRERAISWGTATPMDVVKSRLQADGVHLNKYKGVLDCITQSYQKDGLKVFFRGITVNAVRGFPMSAAMFLGYELSLRAFRGDYAVTSP